MAGLAGLAEWSKVLFHQLPLSTTKRQDIKILNPASATYGLWPVYHRGSKIGDAKEQGNLITKG